MTSRILRGVLLGLTALGITMPPAALASTRGVMFSDPQDEVTNPNGPTRADLAGGTVAYEDSYGTIGVSLSFWQPISESPAGDGTQGYYVAVGLYSSPGGDCGAPSMSADATLFLDLNRGSFGNTIFAYAHGQYFYGGLNSLTTSADGRTLSGAITNPLLINQDFRCVKATVRYQAPLRFDDEYDIRVRVGEIRNSSWTFEYAFDRADGQRCAIGSTVQVILDHTTGKPTFTIGEAEIEIGIGIHGERGVRRGPLRSAAELADETRAVKVTLVDRKDRAVAEDPLLPLLGGVIGPQRRVDGDELGRQSARLGEEGGALGGLQMAVEVTGEHALEGTVGERRRQRVRAHQLCVWDATTGNRQHAPALVQAGEFAAQMSGEEPCAAGHVERACRRQRGDGTLERSHRVRPSGALSRREQAAIEIPVVVLGRPRVVVLPHRSRCWHSASV